MITEKQRKTLVVLEILTILTLFAGAASALNPPTNVVAKLSGTSMTVNWTAATGATQYRVGWYNVTGTSTLINYRYTNATSIIIVVPLGTNCYTAHVRTYLPSQSTNSVVSNKVCGNVTVSDTVPPGSITGLKNVSYAQNYISWTWTNPSDSDFSKVMVYIDGVFRTNVSSGNSYNATSLNSNSTHSIGTHAVDASGNINNTWVNDTRTTAPDIIPVSDTVPPGSITGLKNVSYAQNYINWTWTNPPDSDFSQVMVYIDGLFMANVSNKTNSYNATGLDPSTMYKISTHTVDTSGNVNNTEINDTEMTASAAVSPPIPTNPLTASLTNIVLTVSANGGTPPYTYNWTGIPTLPAPCSGINTDTITCNPTVPGTYNLTITITDKKGNVAMISNDVRVNSPIVQVLTGSVTDLDNITYAQDYINWKWTNPNDPGFDHVEIYVDNGSIINVSNNDHYNKTGLIPNTEHTIHVRTVDINGNDNLTWVNSTRMTAKDNTPPDSISGLYNVSFALDYISWKWTDPSNKDFDHVDVYINGVFNGSVLSGIGGYVAIGLSPGTSYKISTHTVDTSGNINDTWVNDTRRTAIIEVPIQGDNISFVTIGDPHLGEIPDGTANLTLAANFLKGRNNSFDFVVVVGDYHNLTSAQNILGVIGRPYYLVKGNHDKLTLCNTSSFGDNVSNVAGYQLVFVGICGINPGQSILTKSYSKTAQSIVFTHLPSACLNSWDSYYKTGCGFVDTLGINTDKLLGVYSGHVHEYSNQIVNGTLYVTEDNLGGNGAASDYIGYTMIQNKTVNYERLYFR
jgi:hypothetical protein